MEQNSKKFTQEQPQKKISFIVHFPYQWFIYRNIYQKLPSDQREVIVDLNAAPRLQDDELRDSILTLLKEENASFRVLTRVMYLDITGFQKFFSDVEVIVSCWESGCVSSRHTAHIKKVNTTYGLGKELTMVRPSRSIHDVILAYGKRDQEHFSLLTKSIAIGNPRLDNFYNGITDSRVRDALWAFFKDTSKRTVLYVPTHGDLGSFRQALGTLTKLSKCYNIIFKPHYYTLREDQEIVEQYRQTGSIMVIDDSWDTIEVMGLSDVIVSDNSSAIFDAMQVDKPLVVCDFLDRHFLDVIHKKLRSLKRGEAGALTYSESFEQEIKNKGLVVTIKKPGELGGVLDSIQTVDERFKKFRRTLVQDNFAYTDGRSAERAADVIMELYDAERDHVLGILHHAYLAYNNRFYQGIIESDSNDIASSVTDCMTMVWIFCDLSTGEEVLATLYSALSDNQVGQVCVSGSIRGDIAEIFSRDELSQKVSFFESHRDGLQYVYSQIEKFGTLLLARANTQVRDLSTVCIVRELSKRDALFFSENVVVDEKNVSTLFYLLKREVLKWQSISRHTLLFVSYPQIHTIEKSAALVRGKTLLEHAPPLEGPLSFDIILSFCIMIDALKSNEVRASRKEYALMPNFFSNHEVSKGRDVLARITMRWLYLYHIGIPVRRWPDKRIGKFLSKIFSGSFQYYGLLRLLSVKMLSVRKYVFLNRVYRILNQKSIALKDND